MQFDSGEITIAGHSVKTEPLEKQKGLLHIFPIIPDLYDYMTGIKYLNFIADIFGVNEAELEERIHKYAELFLN